MRKFISNHGTQLKILAEITLVLLVFIAIFYYLLPVILNYPAETVGTSFQHELENTDYTVQVVLIGFALFLVFGIIIFYKLRFLKNINYTIKNVDKMSDEELAKLRNKLFKTPYSIYLMNILLPTLIIIVIHTATTGVIGLKLIKMIILLFSFITIIATISLLITRHELTKILMKLPPTEKIGYKKIRLNSRITYHIIPLFMAGIIFTALLGYSRVIIEKGNIIFRLYKNDLESVTANNTIKTPSDLINTSKQIHLIGNSDKIFIYTPDGHFLDSTGKETNYSDFFSKYLRELSAKNEGRVYEYYGEDSQATTKQVAINGQPYILGVYYTISDYSIIIYFVFTFIILLGLDYIILQFFSNTFTSDLKRISNGLSTISKSKNKSSLMNQLPLTSNDEIGEMIIEFNKVQELSQENLTQIHNNQQTLVEKERLASLGQMIGGIAHNLKTPIMSTSGASEGLMDLINEYKKSAGDPDVAAGDHIEIANEMIEWVTKIKSYTSYMSDVISAVKGQAVNMNDQTYAPFTLDEVVKRIGILMKHELNNALINLDVHMDADRSIVLKGNINSLIQVINNMISNAIQAYNGKTNQTIELIFTQDKSNVIITIKDYASGIPKEVQEKLFNSMITTKGKNGTGLGLFMSYSTIKGNFNGNITFTSEEGKGTTFNLILPLT